MPVTFVFIVVSIATFCGFLYYKKFKGSKYTYFLFYLLFTFAIELVYNVVRVVYLKTDEVIFNTSISYNFYLISSFIFLFVFYRSISKNKKNRKLFNVFIGVFTLFIIINYLIFHNGFRLGINIHNLIVGSILLLITLILFLIEIINNKEVIFNIHRSIIFWISIGLLLFYVGVIPIMITRKYLNFNEIYMSILNLLNGIMYGSFVIGFIVSNPKYNY